MSYSKTHRDIWNEHNRNAVTYLYRIFDDDAKTLLYIGIAREPEKRIRQHRHDKWWFPSGGIFTITSYPNRAAALKAELDAIDAESPLHNIQARGRRRETFRGFDDR